MKLALSIALIMGLSSSLYAAKIHCEHTNNFDVTLDDTDGKFSVAISNLGGHQLARELKLPHAGESYRYTLATLNYGKEECFIGTKDPLLFQCAAGETEVPLLSPSAQVPVRWTRVQLTRNTIEHARWGAAKYFELTFEVFSTQLSKQVTETYQFNLDSCRIE